MNKSIKKLLLFIIPAAIIIAITIFLFCLNNKNTTNENYNNNNNVQNEQKPALSTQQPNRYNSTNCTTAWENLMLINPNFQVNTDFINQRRQELVNITNLYGIKEGNIGNGDPLMDPEAAQHLNDMVQAYHKEFNGHTLTTRSCFRSQGTTCGRLCATTGSSDHHTGYTCDLVDDSYGDILDPDLIDQHPDWQWLHKNSARFGFIDRFPLKWSGGSMSEPANIDENGSTGLYETWHYRYVGIDAATDIATGKYNNGEYDSLEHYLKSINAIKNLTDMTATCKN